MNPDTELPPDNTSTQASPHGNTIELLELTWQFFTSAGPGVRAELAQFVADRGWHPIAGPDAYLDSLQFTAYALRTAQPDR